MRTAASFCVALVGAAAFAASAVSASSAPATLQSFSVASAHIQPGKVKLAVTGKLVCTKDAHYHLNVWALERTSGALGKGSLPPKLSATASPAEVQASKNASLCSGASQTWTLTLDPNGSHPAPFVRGPVQVCATITVKKGAGYSDLRQFCSTIAAA
jgi:hypothetical protein